ncbi:MAG: thioredoxin domain-containing protein [Acidobacteriota bacterium]
MSNRLQYEQSPYLLQHAENPVDWYPWGPEAFERARREDKPIFLSIGYSTCHWCHVMERESFENADVARILNEFYVPVKVDREERPDLDRIYMSAVQAMTGSGGWPMSMFLTPELAPFYGGTYYPPEDLPQRPGFKTVLERIHQFWIEEKEKAVESAGQLIDILNEERAGDPLGADPTPALMDAAYQALEASYDPSNAGFGTGAKFPRPVVFAFLFRYYRRTKQEKALEMTLATLVAMASGGMYDHIGGGFHRYTVDPEWRVPHFEKMLYDQAQLVHAYVDAFALTRDGLFEAAARETLEYVLRDLKNEEGGFFSAEDADSREHADSPEAKEGAFYVWTKEEIDRVLSPEESRVVTAYYSIKEEGNVQSDPHGEFSGKNILSSLFTIDEVAEELGLDPQETETLLEAAKAKLLEARAARPRPFLDDKSIAAWNGLMISALAKASRVLEDARLLEAAAAGARFLIRSLYNPEDKTLRRVWRKGRAYAEAHLEDYAAVIDGLLELHLAGGGEEWLQLAQKLSSTEEALFWDAAEGGFFETSGRDRSVLVRMKEMYDGAEPAGNSMAAMNLLRLSRLTQMPAYQMQARKTLRSACARIALFPQMMPMMMCAVDAWLSPGEFSCTPEGCALPEGK